MLYVLGRAKAFKAKVVCEKLICLPLAGSPFSHPPTSLVGVGAKIFKSSKRLCVRKIRKFSCDKMRTTDAHRASTVVCTVDLSHKTDH